MPSETSPRTPFSQGIAHQKQRHLATLPYAVEIVNKGWERAMRESNEIKLGANVIRGKITYKAVAEAFGLDYTSIDDLL